MKPYTIPILFVVFLSTAVIGSCNKEKPPVPGSTTTRFYPTAAPNVTNVIYADLYTANSTDRVFNFLKPASTYTINCAYTYCTVRSRYILLQDGKFLLQYNYDDAKEYRRGIQYKGLYTQTNNTIYFSWEGWSVA